MELLTFAAAGFLLAWALFYLKTRKMGFLAQEPEDYAPMTPELNIRDHLNGPLTCEGMIYGPTGRVSSRFVADMDVSWEGNKAVMREQFRYDSGTVQNREWHLEIGNDGRIKATAADVIGEGEGQQKGSALKLTYKIKLTDEAGGHVLDTVDWMYLVENGTIINRSQFRKFGIKVGELVATFRPANEDVKRAA